MAKVLYEKRNRIAYVTPNRLDALNAYSSLGDFSEARERLAAFTAREKDRQKE